MTATLPAVTVRVRRELVGDAVEREGVALLSSEAACRRAGVGTHRQRQRERSLPVGLAPATRRDPWRCRSPWRRRPSPACDVSAMLRPSAVVSVRATRRSIGHRRHARLVRHGVDRRGGVATLGHGARVAGNRADRDAVDQRARRWRGSNARSGHEPCTELAAVAVTPVRLIFELMAVAFAVALSAVTPAALVAGRDTDFHAVDREARTVERGARSRPCWSPGRRRAGSWSHPGYRTRWSGWRSRRPGTAPTRTCRRGCSGR